MLSEDKIKLMTATAMFEKKEGKTIFPITRCFKSDYVTGRMFRAFFGYTFCYILFIVVWCLYSIDRLLNMVDSAQILETAAKLAFFYVAGLAVYLVITCAVYARRYDYASRGMRIYLAKLKRLDKRYEFQNKTSELAKEGIDEKSSRV